MECYRLMKYWLVVGPAFLLKFSFRVVASGTDLAQWVVVDSSWNPLPVYTALSQMPK